MNWDYDKENISEDEQESFLYSATPETTPLGSPQRITQKPDYSTPKSQISKNKIGFFNKHGDCPNAPMKNAKTHKSSAQQKGSLSSPANSTLRSPYSFQLNNTPSSPTCYLSPPAKQDDTSKGTPLKDNTCEKENFSGQVTNFAENSNIKLQQETYGVHNKNKRTFSQMKADVKADVEPAEKTPEILIKKRKT